MKPSHVISTSHVRAAEPRLAPVGNLPLMHVGNGGADLSMARRNPCNAVKADHTAITSYSKLYLSYLTVCCTIQSNNYCGCGWLPWTTLGHALRICCVPQRTNKTLLTDPRSALTATSERCAVSKHKHKPCSIYTIRLCCSHEVMVEVDYAAYRHPARSRACRG